jgi:hypothetical protein
LDKYFNIHINTARRIIKNNNIYKNHVISLHILETSKLELIKKDQVLNKPHNRKAKKKYIYNIDKTILIDTCHTVNEFIKKYKSNGSEVKLACLNKTLWRNKYFLMYDKIEKS